MSTRPAADPIEDHAPPRPPVEEMLRSLPAQHREIIIATYFQHRTTLEAARLLGLAPETARARLYRAMSDLSGMVAAGWPATTPSPAPRPECPSGAAGRRRSFRRLVRHRDRHNAETVAAESSVPDN